jgi:hypothetical protein
MGGIDGELCPAIMENLAGRMTDKAASHHRPGWLVPATRAPAGYGGVALS